MPSPSNSDVNFVLPTTRQSTPSSSSNGSGSYADIESASNVLLLPLKQNHSASVIDVQGRKSSRTSTIAVVSLVISALSLTLLALFAGWVFVWNNGELMPARALGLEGDGQKSEVCLPCVQISPNPLDGSPSTLWEELDVKYEDTEENATEICCASSSAQFAALFKLILQRQQAVKKLADTLDRESQKRVGDDVTKGEVSQGIRQAGQSAVSAHLVFKPKTQTRRAVATTADGSREPEWQSPNQSPVSHVREGLQFQKKRIIVQTPGLYYVYCQILYSPSPSPSPSSSDVIASSHDVVSAYVRRYSILRPAAPDFLLKSRHTRHDVREDRHSSYVGGVFRLHSGDSLHVQVSRPDLISYDAVGSFFGMFRIGD